MNPAVLELNNVTKTFFTSQRNQPVLNGVSISFVQNKSYAIMGPSGAGKSTLMHIIAGLDKPTHGTVLYNGKNIYQITHQEHQLFLQKSVGLLFQEPYLLAELTVIENVMLPGLIAKKNKNQILNYATELIDAVGLSSKKESKPGELSGGQQQRIALARALMNKPKFLIADEPTGSLDLKSGQEIVELILSLGKTDGMGIIVSTHDHYVGQAMDTIINLKDGTLQ